MNGIATVGRKRGPHPHLLHREGMFQAPPARYRHVSQIEAVEREPHSSHMRLGAQTGSQIRGKVVVQPKVEKEPTHQQAGQHEKKEQRKQPHWGYIDSFLY